MRRTAQDEQRQERSENHIKVVRKPELVTVVVSRPICWVTAAVNSAQPRGKKTQPVPARHRRGRLALPARQAARRPGWPERKRRPMNQSGPIAAMAVDCATKPHPRWRRQAAGRDWRSKTGHGSSSRSDRQAGRATMRARRAACARPPLASPAVRPVRLSGETLRF